MTNEYLEYIEYKANKFLDRCDRILYEKFNSDIPYHIHRE